MQIKNGFTLFTLNEFDQWLQESRFSRAVKLVQNHHTWLPDYSCFKTDNHFALLKGMNDAHLARGFDMIAQNLTTFPDGTVALCRPIDRIPAGIKGANSNGICCEHLGNFDGKDDMTSVHREAIIRVNALLCREFSLTPSCESIVYHHWYDLNSGERTNGSGTTKTCPGTAFFGGNSVDAAETNFIPLVSASLGKVEPAANPSSVPGGKSATVNVGNNLNVRSAPDGNTPLIASLRRGALVNVYETVDNWSRIHPAEQRWVADRYLAYA